jgi:outer membrane protein assembly factor BamB
MRFRAIGRCIAFLLILAMAAVGFTQGTTVSGVTLRPSTIAGGGTSTGTVTLSGPATGFAVAVTLSSSNSNVSVPATVTVAQNASTATFTATSKATGSNYSSSITASLGTGSSESATLKVVTNGVASVAFGASAITAGDTSTGTVTLLAAAPSTGWTVTLGGASRNDTMPTSLTIASGKTTGTFVFSTSTAASTTYVDTILASDSSTSQSFTLTVDAEALRAIGFPTFHHIQAGNSLTGTVALQYPAPLGGWKVSLASTNTNLATVPASVTIPYGQSSTIFTVTSVPGANGADTITGKDQNSSVSDSLDVLLYTGISSVVVAPTTFTAGGSATCTVNLIYPSPSQGWTVTIRNVSKFDPVPPTLTIPAGATSASFTFQSATTNDTSYSDVISATDPVTTALATFTANRESLARIALTPSSLQGGASSTATVVLSQTAPTNGWPITLTSNNSSVTVPSTVTVPAGATSATFAIKTTLPSTNCLAVIEGTDNFGWQASAPLTVYGPYPQEVLVSPSTIIPTQTSTGTIALNLPAPSGGMVVPLTASSTNVTIPKSVTVPAGATTANFTITPIANAPATSVLITATISGTSTSATLTLRPTNVNWKYLVGTSVQSKAAVTGLGIIEVGGATSTGGIFDALTPSGTLTWNDGPYSAPASSPTIANGNTYVAAGTTVYSYNSKGVLVWSLAPSPGNLLTSSLTVSGSSIYVGCSDGYLYKISTGGSLDWKYDVASTVTGQPVVDSSGNVYFGTPVGNFLSVSSSGTKNWRFSAPGEILGSPVLGSDGTIYFGCGDNNLYALTPAGVKKWSYDSGGILTSTPIIGPDGTIYFGSQDKNFYAITSTGAYKWSFTAKGEIISTPILSSAGILYFGSLDGNVYALNTSGGLVWYQSLTALGVQGAPTIDSKGYVDIGSNDGYFTSFLP